MTPSWVNRSAVILLIVCGTTASAQFGRPPVTPHVEPFRPPAFRPPPRIPNEPHDPRFGRPADDTKLDPETRIRLEREANESELDRRWRLQQEAAEADPEELEASRIRHAEKTAIAARSASSVGLLASPLGQGPLLLITTPLADRIDFDELEQLRYERDMAATLQAAGGLGLLAAPLGQGPFLLAMTPFPDRIDPERLARQQRHAGQAPEVGRNKDAAKDPMLAKPSVPAGSSDWIIPVFLLGGAIIAILAIVGRALMASTWAGVVRIVAVPPGEAPELVRRAWVGLELPVTRHPPEASGVGVEGILSSQAAVCADGYAVSGAEAVRILGIKDPTAAAWWHNNAPHILRGGYELVFPANVCDRVN